MRETQIPIGRLLSAIGGVLLIVSLALDWYDELSGFTSFEVLDLLLVALALVTFAALAAALGVLRTGFRPGTDLAHRRLVSAAREVLATGDYSLYLGALAGHVGCSAAHLSRVFRRTTGRSMTSYRNELRVRAVLRDLTDGATSLRTLAATYGFADQAHLSRVAKKSLGMAPSRARTMLSAPSAKSLSAKG